VPTSPSSISSTLTPSSYVCSSGWFSCAASLGGGCCQNGRTCTTGASCIGQDTSSPMSTQAPSAPVRPTSNSAITSHVPSITSDPAVSICPTGFYVCSAYYPSGCCRVGRDCQTSGSCAPIPSVTVVNSNGVTIVAGSGAEFATTAPAPRGSVSTLSPSHDICLFSAHSVRRIGTAARQALEAIAVPMDLLAESNAQLQRVIMLQ
jgi:hypothetical protein